MKLFHSLDDFPADFGPVIATIGNFDGVHRGHRWVIGQVNARAQALGLRSLAITFDPHPARVLRPDAPHVLITPRVQKLALLAETGLDTTVVLPFTQALSRVTAEQFAREVLQDRLRVREVHEGETFRFGHQAAADVESLASLGRDLGFLCEAYSPYVLRGEPVSSSRIRKLLCDGEVSQARALLGRPFTVWSTPASGRGYGTRYTVPTINLAPYPELLPAMGVYITTLTVAGECFQAVTNVGNRPTFGADSFTVESHLLDFHPIELQADTPLELAFLKRLRAENKFDSPEALLAQIRLDVGRAERYFRLAIHSAGIHQPATSARAAARESRIRSGSPTPR